MEFTKLKYRCLECEAKLERLVRVFHPDEFSPKGTKSVLFQSWCDKCNEPIVLRYSFKEEDRRITAGVTAYVKTDTGIVPKKQKLVDELTARPGKKSKGGPL